MSQLRLKNKRHRHSGRDSDLDALVEAAAGLYGTPLGCGRFLRKLPDPVLRQALDPQAGTPALLLITAHALLIVKGRRTRGCPRASSCRPAARSRGC